MSTPSATTDTRIPSALPFPKPLHHPITCSKCKTTFPLPPSVPQWTCPKCDIKVWQDYDSAKACAVCNSSLGIGNRHHCHRCGSCVCGDCGQYMMHLTNSKKDKDRVCKACAFPPLQETTLSGFLTKVSKDAKTGKETARNLRYFELRKNILMYTTDRTTTWKSFFVLDGVEVIGGLKEDASCGFTIQLPSNVYNPSFAQHGPLHLISDKESEAQKWMNAIGQAAVASSPSSSNQYYIDDQTRKQMTQQAFAQKQTSGQQQQQPQQQNNNNNNNNIDNDSLASSQQQMVGTIHKFDNDVTPSVEGMLIKIGAKSAGTRNERHFRLFDRYLQYAESDRKKSPNAKDEFDIFGAEVTTVSDKEEPSLFSKGDCGIKIDKGPFMKRCPLILVASNSTSRNGWIGALQAATGNPHQQQYNNNNSAYGNNNNNYRSPSPIRRVGGGEINNNNTTQHQTRNYESPDRNNYPKLIDRLHVKIEISQDRRRRDPAMFDLWNDQIVTFNSLDSSNTSLEDLIKLVENVVFDGRTALNLGFEGILLVPGKLIAYRQSLFPVDDAENISATLRDLEDLRGDDESAGLFHKLGDYTFLDEIPLYAEDTIIWRDMFTLESLMMKRNYFSSPQSNANNTSMLRSDRNRKILTVQDESYIVNKSPGRYDDNDNDNDSVVNAGTPPPLSVEDYNNRYHMRSPPSPQTPRRQYDDFDVNHRTVSPPRNQQHSNYYPRPPVAASPSHDSPYVSPQRSPRNSSNNVALPPESNIVSPSRRSTSPVMLMNQIHQHEQQQRRYHEQLSFVREQQQQQRQQANNNNNNMTSPSLISVSESRVISSPTNYRGLPVKSSIIPSNRNWITAAYPHHPDPYRDPPSKAELLADRLEKFGNNKSY